MKKREDDLRLVDSALELQRETWTQQNTVEPEVLLIYEVGNPAPGNMFDAVLEEVS